MLLIILKLYSKRHMEIGKLQNSRMIHAHVLQASKSPY